MAARVADPSAEPLHLTVPELHGDGSFDHGGASLSVPGGVPLFPGVDLTELGVTFALDPTRLSGDATVSVAGGLVTIHGGVLVVFANQCHPYTYQSQALPGLDKLQTTTEITSTAIGLAGTVGLRLPVVGETDLANGYIFYVAPSYFEFAGQFHVGAFGVTLDGGVHGALDPASSRFSPRRQPQRVRAGLRRRRALGLRRRDRGRVKCRLWWLRER